MFISAVWSVNLSYLFTFGSLKIESFIVSVLFSQQNLPQLTFICYSLRYSLWSHATERNYLPFITFPSYTAVVTSELQHALVLRW